MNFYLASEYAFAFADNKKVAGYNDKNSNNWNNAKHHQLEQTLILRTLFWNRKKYNFVNEYSFLIELVT